MPAAAPQILNESYTMVERTNKHRFPPISACAAWRTDYGLGKKADTAYASLTAALRSALVAILRPRQKRMLASSRSVHADVVAVYEGSVHIQTSVPRMNTTSQTPCDQREYLNTSK